MVLSPMVLSPMVLTFMVIALTVFALVVPRGLRSCMAVLAKVSGLLRRAFSQSFVGWTAIIILATVPTSANALFGRFMPLSLSGSVNYNYAYNTTGDQETETTTLGGTLNAAGYIWQPWFASTSAAINLGLSNTESSTSSSDSTITSGAVGLSVFPRSRFPFSLNYSLSDSRSDSFQNQAGISGDSHYTVARLTLRQLYEGRASRHSIGSRTSLWYSTTEFESNRVSSESESMGVKYQIRLVPHNFTVAANRSTSSASNSSSKPLTDVVNVTHSYTPDTDIGITNLATTIKIDDGTGTTESTVSQVSSNFFWRPEHRAVNFNGGVRVSESETQSDATSTEQKSLSTNLGFSYRLTRRLNFGASVALGTSESGAIQSLTTSEAARLGYSSSHSQIAGFGYRWQWGLNASNSDTSTDDGTTETSNSSQTMGMQLGHSVSKQWVPGKGSSVGMNLSQSGNVNKSSENDEPSRGMNHSAGLSFNRRGRSGAFFGNLQASDSRTYSQQDTEFQNVNVSISQDLTISRLSSLGGTVSYTESHQETISDVPGASSSNLSRSAMANFSYRHDRPFGIYNMNFTSRLTGSKQIDSFNPETLWDWDNRLRYRLGLLDTSLSLRIIESAGGRQSKSLYFQATRSF